MRRALVNWFNVSAYTSLVEQNRARVVYGITTVMVVLFSGYVLLAPPANVNRESFRQEIFHEPSATFFVVAFYGFAGIALLGVRAGRLNWAAWCPPLMWLCGACIDPIQTGVAGAAGGAALFGLVTLTGLLNGNRGALVSLLVALGIVIAGILRRPYISESFLLPYITSADDLASTGGADLLAIGFQLIGGAGLVYLFLHYARLSRVEGASQAVEDRQITSEILTQIAQQVARRASLKDLLAEIADLINARFDFIYHTQVFLIDDSGQEARLVASTGMVGRKLLEQQHSLGVGTTSVIGQVTQQGKPLVARADAKDTIHHRNELLPDTVVEAAFPLRIGAKVIGALDVQSRLAIAFGDVNLLATFQALADSIALAIDNVGQYESAEARLKENARLMEEMRAALHEVERLNERLTGRAWTEYLREAQAEFSRAADLTGSNVTAESNWTTTMQEALTDNHLVQKQEDGHQTIAVPLRIRGRVVGALEFELDETHSFTPEEFDLVQEVGDRFGMAAENARLMDETRRVAQREALVNQIISRLQTSNNVNVMLDEAARGLHEALKANRVAICLGKPPRNL